MTGQFIVGTITEHHPIEGADLIVSSVLYGEAVIIGKESTPVGTRGILIDCESRLLPDIAHKLNMYRHSDLNEDKTKKGYLPDNGRVKPIRLKGCKCTALFLSFEQLEPIVGEILLDDGVQANTLNGITICEKYIRRYNTGVRRTGKAGRAKEDRVPLFREHISTDHLMKFVGTLQLQDDVVATVKLHGTSGRVFFGPIKNKTRWYHRLFGLTPRTKYGYATGSRRVVKTIDGVEKPGDHFYESNIWASTRKIFEGKLNPGETVYFEIVGYTPEGSPIHPSHPTKKLKPFFSKEEYKLYVNTYGDNISMGYGCKPGEHKVFVYRMTLTNEQGTFVDYSWERVKRRCLEMQVDHVPEIDKGYIADVQSFVERIEDETNEVPCSAFPHTLREGVVVRIDRGGEVPLLYKHKSYAHKVLENIIKDNPDYTDIEEEQSI